MVTKRVPSEILVVDDDDCFSTVIRMELEERGVVADQAKSPGEALAMLEKRKGRQYKLVLIDLGMAPSEELEEFSGIRGVHAAPETGLALAKFIRKSGSAIPLLGISAIRASVEVERWFKENGRGFYIKGEMRLQSFARVILRILYGSKALRSVIVHGHDNATMLSVKNFLQNSLGLPEPIVLREQPDLGRTILEKFESAAEEADIVFALLTPDDIAGCRSHGEDQRRARQNVVLELGYFLGLFGRRSGRVMLLYKGDTELPSDIAGLIYIDISSGIEAAGDRIRREVASL